MGEKKHGREWPLEQILAIRFAGSIGEKIANDYPQIADDYRQGNTLKEIANNYNLAQKYGLRIGKLILNGLGRAIKILIPEEERQILKKRHQRKNAREVLISTLGYIPFSNEEKRYLLELSENPKYQYDRGGNRGRPNYKLISKELKRKFGIKRPTGSLSSTIYMLRKETR